MPSENIIVFAYDDIANNSQNPFLGKVFNKPSQGPGIDYYEGIQIDYNGADVNPEVFLAVITGDKEKVTEKGSEKYQHQVQMTMYLLIFQIMVQQDSFHSHQMNYYSLIS